MDNRLVEFPDLSGLKLGLTYCEIDSFSPLNTFDSHIHDEYEIYVNLSGDVSFVVENSIYPISTGSIILVRPGQFHHCVYHSNAMHRHFWLLISAKNGKELLDGIFEKNGLLLSGNCLSELVALCHSLINSQEGDAERFYCFFKLLRLINAADGSADDEREPSCIDLALNFIHENITENISVSDIARASFVSVNTLERHFASKLHTSPSAYLKKRRLAHAAELLQKGASVTYACHQSGFIDCSKFISLFKSHYGTTPLKWRGSPR